METSTKTIPGTGHRFRIIESEQNRLYECLSWTKPPIEVLEIVGQATLAHSSQANPSPAVNEWLQRWMQILSPDPVPELDSYQESESAVIRVPLVPGDSGGPQPRDSEYRKMAAWNQMVDAISS